MRPRGTAIAMNILNSDTVTPMSATATHNRVLLSGHATGGVWIAAGGRCVTFRIKVEDEDSGRALVNYFEVTAWNERVDKASAVREGEAVFIIGRLQNTRRGQSMLTQIVLIELQRL